MAVTYRNAGHLAPPASVTQQQLITRSQQEEQQQLEAARLEKARRSSRKPTDRHIPDELAAVVVGDGVQRYEQLREAERRLDALMMRKRLDVKDSAQRALSKREGTLRVWISNTAEGQPWQVVEDGSGFNADGTFDFGDENSSATYRVKVEGRLLDSEEEAQEKAGKATSTPKFSSFFREITVDYQRSPDELEPDGFAQIGWHRQQPTPQNPTIDPNSKENSFDTLEFERKGDESINVTINLVRDYKIERYRLSPPLADLLDTAEDDMAGIMQGIWEYARAQNLQEDDDKRTITCDEALSRVSAMFMIGSNLLTYGRSSNFKRSSSIAYQTCLEFMYNHSLQLS